MCESLDRYDRHWIALRQQPNKVCRDCDQLIGKVAKKDCMDKYICKDCWRARKIALCLTLLLPIIGMALFLMSIWINISSALLMLPITLWLGHIGIRISVKQGFISGIRQSKKGRRYPTPMARQGGSFSWKIWCCFIGLGDFDYGKTDNKIFDWLP